jgi:hypothetical protein
MKELKHVGNIIQQHYPLPNSRGTKRWILAQRQQCRILHETDNASIESSYHQLLNAVKSHHLKLGEVYFERDYKHDRSEGLTGMHCFITENFYWRLDCAFTYNCEISFAFSDCSYETEIRSFMQAYPLDRVTTEKQLAPDFETFYNTVLAVQDPAFIHSFTR